jgi:hypothetical protein
MLADVLNSSLNLLALMWPILEVQAELDRRGRSTSRVRAALARAHKLGAGRRSQIARDAALERWKGSQKPPKVTKTLRRGKS